MSDKKERNLIIAAGAIVGLFGALLVKFGNPKNMGFCIACFIRDIAGAVGMHRAAVVQYIRPEIIGLVIGAFVIAVATKEFKPKGGSSPFTRFILAFFVMVGALVFLGCPLRMVLRMAGGDLNAYIGFAGFICGILCGVFFLNKGFSLKRSYTQPAVEGAAISIVNLVLLVLLIAAPAFIFFSESGPGSQHAPMAIALAAGLIVGAAAQKSRLCMVGGIRDVVLFKDFKLITGFGVIFAVCLIVNIALGNFKFSMAEQPVAHTEILWNFLGLFLVGLGSCLLGGCPLRQLILAGEGNGDSAVSVMGFAVGAAFCHNFGLASSGAGTTPNGRIACIIGIIVCIVIGFLNLNNDK